VILSSRRPGECRDPNVEESRFGSKADAFCSHQRQGLWIPAFAGTTRGEIVPYAIALDVAGGILTGGEVSVMIRQSNCVTSPVDEFSQSRGVRCFRF
jgi:hypothetical protein